MGDENVCVCVCVCVCLNKFPRTPNFIGVFFGAKVGNLFGVEGIGTHLFEGAKIRKKMLSVRKNIFFIKMLVGWERVCNQNNRAAIS